MIIIEQQCAYFKCVEVYGDMIHADIQNCLYHRYLPLRNVGSTVSD